MRTFTARDTLLPVVLSLAVVMGCAGARASTPAAGRGAPEQLGAAPEPLAQAPPARARVQALLSTLPLYFMENRGQFDERVAYYVQGRDTAVYFTAEGVTIALVGPAADTGTKGDERQPPVRPVGWGSAPEADGTRQRWTVRLEFVGANREVTPSGQEPTPARISYFKGPEAEWKTGLPTYASVVYRDLWPGIDLVYRGTAGRLKYTFLVKPWADPGQIKLAYRGAATVRLTEGEELEVSTPVGGFRDARPVSYQEVEGQRVEVATAYVLEDAGESGWHVYGFRVGAYDRDQLLVLDPVVLVYAGYIGGAQIDDALGIALDAAGNAFVTGYTSSTEATFPVRVGPDVTFNGGPYDFDAFVAKVAADGTGLLYAGYIGGATADFGTAIAVDAAGNAYVTGLTGSTEATFPVRVGPDLTHNGGSYDAFVAKVTADGTRLVYAGYIGGANFDEGLGVAVDAAGNAYVTGYTGSTEANFPVRVGPDLTHNGGSYDAFVAKVKADGTGLLFAGYIGGAGADFGTAIAVDAAGNAYVTGYTSSNEATFPVRVGPDLTHNGNRDAFVAKVAADGTGLAYAGYIGGAGDDYGSGIAVDAAGNAYVTGFTTSIEATFPVRVGPDLTHNGGPDGFVAKVRADGTGLVYAGYIGGAGYDVGSGIAVDAAGNAYVSGFTDSTEATFPVTVGPDLTHNGGRDAFAAKVRADGTGLIYAGYIGGAEGDGVPGLGGAGLGTGIAVDAAGNAYVAGGTLSTEATFPVRVGPDLTHNGGSDAFVVKISAVGVIGIRGTLALGEAPAVGVTVRLRNKLNGAKVCCTRTDGTGTYQFDPGAGTYRIRIKPLEVPGPTTVSGTLEVKEAPSVGTKVRFKNLETGAKASTLTDASGAFSFAGVEAGSYKIIIPTVTVP
jgi:acyl-CoA hydrolase